MRLDSRKFVVRVILLSLAVIVHRAAGETMSPEGPRMLLHDGWAIQSSSTVTSSGEQISVAGYSTRDWIESSVPTTVVGAQVKKKLLPDPFSGMNLRQYPGMDYPIGKNFSNVSMDKDSPYAVSWWYRKEFSFPAEIGGKTVWLNFDGINYRANIFLNGKKIADARDVAGAWRTYEFNVTAEVRPGQNALAVQVWVPTKEDLAITFVDWNPMPPDKDMGIFRNVYLTTSGPVAVRHPAVISRVDSPANDLAHLTVTATIKNASNQAVHGTLKGKIEDIEFEQQVALQPDESKDITFKREQFPQLDIHHPRLWWPWQMGEPNLYDLTMSFEIAGATSDVSRTKFGIREITSEVTEYSPGLFKRLFRVNGKNILIRGGGWTPDMMLREDSQRTIDEFRYVKDMGLNTVRLEGKLEANAFFDLADRDGILVMAGWCCCDFWEQWGKWKDETFEVAKQSLRDQMYRLRSHPSLLIWLNGSDNPPPAKVEEAYLTIERELLWPNPTMSSATAKQTSVTNASGGKMTGPYEYVPPSYWMTDPHRPLHERKCDIAGCGGADGFNTETSMGPAVPNIESVRRMVGNDHLWPVDDVWNFHAGGGEFKTIKVFTEALNARYGKATGAEDFTFKSQLMTYEGVRAMFEAYARNKYSSTGVIQWMLNNAWPSMIWHLYDYYLQPGGGYFGAKKALQPINPVYGYDDRAVWLVNNRYVDAKGLKLSVQVLNQDASVKFSQEAMVDVAADNTIQVLTLPQVDGLSPAYFLDLRVTDGSGKLVGSNFYWLSTKPETLNWAKSNWYTTPTSSFADYSSLAQLPKVKLSVLSNSEIQGESVVTHVTLVNQSKSIAFFLRLKVTRDQNDEEILPVIWEDNYITLLPDEKREVTATYNAAATGRNAVGQPDAVVRIKGWNVE